MLEKGIIPLQETATSRAAFWSHIPLGLSAEGAAGKQHNENIKIDLKIKFGFLEINKGDKLKKTHKFPIVPYFVWVLKEKSKKDLIEKNMMEEKAGYHEQSLVGRTYRYLNSNNVRMKRQLTQSQRGWVYQ